MGVSPLACDFNPSHVLLWAWEEVILLAAVGVVVSRICCPPIQEMRLAAAWAQWPC